MNTFEIKAKKDISDAEKTVINFRYFPTEKGDVSVNIFYYDGDSIIEESRSTISFI